jgi:Na+-translocating ferredoxin:NAD+ oxidoreductase RnfC subunit
MECGLCSYICPSNIDVRSFIKKAKRGVKWNMQ